MTALVYVAGPMSGLPEFNYPAFHSAAGKLRAAGFMVLSPAENPAPNPSPEWEDWMRAAIGQLIRADGVALLPGWSESRGAQLEAKVARALNIERRTVPGWLTQAGQDAHMLNLLGAEAGK